MGTLGSSLRTTSKLLSSYKHCDVVIFSIFLVDEDSLCKVSHVTVMHTIHT